jgi:glucosylceramidase
MRLDSASGAAFNSPPRRSHFPDPVSSTSRKAQHNLAMRLFLLSLWGAALCSASAEVSSWLTTSDPGTGAVIKLLEPQAPIAGVEQHASSDNQANFIIDASQSKQNILGYGAGLPQASASVLFNLKGRNQPLYDSVLQKLFGVEDDGAAINILRFPIGSCDFSIHNTSYDEHKDDYNLEYFAIDDDSRMIVTVLQDALKVNPNLVLIASPWSAPSWLKAFGTLIAYSEKNTLLATEAAYTTYARYFASVLKAYQDAGLTIQYFTLQNEPLFGNSDQYPGMYFSSDQAIKLGENRTHFSILGCRQRAVQ